MKHPVRKLQVVDSHTAGEPTRTVIAGGPLMAGSVADQAKEFHGLYDQFRSAVVNEPRGSGVKVGPLWFEPAGF